VWKIWACDWQRLIAAAGGWGRAWLLLVDHLRVLNRRQVTAPQRTVPMADPLRHRADSGTD
jgi:hypothetical protein